MVSLRLLVFLWVSPGVIFLLSLLLLSSFFIDLFSFLLLFILLRFVCMVLPLLLISIEDRSLCW